VRTGLKSSLRITKGEQVGVEKVKTKRRDGGKRKMKSSCIRVLVDRKTKSGPRRTKTKKLAPTKGKGKSMLGNGKGA